MSSPQTSWANVNFLAGSLRQGKELLRCSSLLMFPKLTAFLRFEEKGQRPEDLRKQRADSNDKNTVVDDLGHW